jgi:hypothetical protein
MNIFACPESGDAICFFIFPFAGRRLNSFGGHEPWGAFLVTLSATSSVIRSMLGGQREQLQAVKAIGIQEPHI